MEDQKKWIDHHGAYSYTDIPSIHRTLPAGVYELQRGMMGFYLQHISSNFQVPSKIYDLEDDFINRVMTTFNAHNRNFGVLLKGLKGTGKTITAKLIANKLNLPIVLVTKPWADIGTYINSIEQDMVLFFDEFEKTYQLREYTYGEDEDHNTAAGDEMQPSISNLLTLMDGVFTSKYKRLFLLTSNRDYLPNAMVARPGRVRYVKNFQDLELKAIMEILNDSINNIDLIPGLVTLLKGLEIITVDIVRAVAEEANLYNTSDLEFFEIFNVKRIAARYDLFIPRSEHAAERIISTNDFNPGTYFKAGRHISSDDGEKVYIVTQHLPEEHKVIMYDSENTGKNKHPFEASYRKSILGHRAFMDFYPGL